MLRLTKYLFWFAFFSGSPLLFANDVLELSPDEEIQSLSPFLQIVEDQSKKITTREILKKLKTSSLNRKKYLSLSINDSNYWIRFKIANNTSEATSRIMVLDYIFADLTELYSVHASKLYLEDSIDLEHSAFERTIPFRSPAFQLDISPNSHREFILKVHFKGKANHALEIKPTLYSTSAFLKHQIKLHFVLVGLLGLLLALGLYNTILYFRVGQSGHIFYSLYLYSYVLIILSYEGFIFYLPSPPSTSSVITIMSIMPLLASISLIAFGRNILQLQKFSKRLNKFYRWAVRIISAMLPLTLANIGWLNLALELSVILLTFSLGVVAAFLSKSNHKAAKYFAISFVFIALGYFIETLLYSLPFTMFFEQSNSIAFISWVEQYLFYTFVVVEMFFLALALGTYIEQFRIDKESAKASELKLLIESNQLKDKYTEELEHTVAQRTKDVSKQKNELAKKNIYLLKEDRLKSNFLAAASHDLRQPLHSLGLFIGALKYCNDEREIKNIYQQMEASQESLTQLFDALLDISKIDAAEINIQKIPVSVDEILSNLVSQFKIQAEQKKLTLKYRACDAVIYTDPILLERILTNMLTNALRYTEVGGVLIAGRKCNSRLFIQVFDTGCGIPFEQQEFVFEEFKQLPNPQRNREQGLGLGLAIVKRLCHLLDCPLTLKSVLGRGSVFTVSLALSNKEIIENNNVKQVIGNQNLHNKRIWVIDDEPEVLVAMSTMLEKWGSKVSTAESLDSVLEMIDNGFVMPDIIVTDYQLANNQTGIEVIEIIRRHYNKIIPSLLVTGNTVIEKLIRTKPSDCPVLNKPVSPAKLRIMLNSLI